MTGVRRKKTRRNTTIKITKGMRKRKKFVNPSVTDNVLKEHWDTSKTLQQNMKSLGLAYNSNTNSTGLNKKKITRKRLLKEEKMADAGMTMEIEKKPVVNTAVVDEFTKIAANGKQLERHIAPGEAKFLMELIQTHSTNYKAMSRDKRNTYQHTSKQLQRKCEGLLKSNQLEKYKTIYPGILPSITEEEEKMET